MTEYHGGAHARSHTKRLSRNATISVLAAVAAVTLMLVWGLRANGASPIGAPQPVASASPGDVVGCDQIQPTLGADGQLDLPIRCFVPPAVTVTETTTETVTTPVPVTTTVTQTVTQTVTATPSPSGPPPTTPPATTPPPGGFPGAANTGVPAGVSLAAYSGPCNITVANTVIDAKLVNCDLTINAFGVVISNTRINGQITMGSGALTITDSEIMVGSRRGVTGLSNHDWTATRVEISGGNRGALCDNNCTLRDSWIHGTYVAGTDHASGARASQNTNYIHNTLACDVQPTPQDGGCSADLTMYPDYAPVRNVLIQGNLFVANTGAAFCAYGGYIPSKPFGGDPTNATNIRFVDNVFQRGSNRNCAAYGPIDSWGAGRTGNVWQNNRWEDGAIVNP